jgi:hypothetical protein
MHGYIPEEIAINVVVAWAPRRGQWEDEESQRVQDDDNYKHVPDKNSYLCIAQSIFFNFLVAISFYCYQQIYFRVPKTFQALVGKP